MRSFFGEPAGMASPEKPSSTRSTDRPGLRFNSVGVEEPAREVLVQQVDPAVKRRTMIFVTLAVVAVLALVITITLKQFVVGTTSEGRGTNRTFQAPAPPINPN